MGVLCAACCTRVVVFVVPSSRVVALYYAVISVVVYEGSRVFHVNVDRDKWRHPPLFNNVTNCCGRSSQCGRSNQSKSHLSLYHPALKIPFIRG
jgi:hypothetical protein